MDILELLQIKQVIADATRITSNTASLLGIIATNRPDKIKESGVFQLVISDHSLVYVCLKISLPRDKPKMLEGRNLNDYNSLMNSPWNQNDPDQPWDQFRNIFNHVSDIYAPVKTRKLGAHILHG